MRVMFLAGLAPPRSGETGQFRQVVFICEGWLSLASEDGTTDVPPSCDPNCKELLVSASLEPEEQDGRLVSATAANLMSILSSFMLLLFPSVTDSLLARQLGYAPQPGRVQSLLAMNPSSVVISERERLCAQPDTLFVM